MCDTAKKIFFSPSYFHFISALKSRQKKCAKGKKNTTPRNILLQFFLTSKPTYQKNIQIFTSDGSVT